MRRTRLPRLIAGAHHSYPRPVLGLLARLTTACCGFAGMSLLEATPTWTNTETRINAGGGGARELVGERSGEVGEIEGRLSPVLLALSPEGPNAIWKEAHEYYMRNVLTANTVSVASELVLHAPCYTKEAHCPGAAGLAPTGHLFILLPFALQR